MPPHPLTKHSRMRLGSAVRPWPGRSAGAVRWTVNGAGASPDSTGMLLRPASSCDEGLPGGAGIAARLRIVREMARSRMASTSSLVRPSASFQRVSVRTCASRTCGDGTASGSGPGWPRDSQSASYTAPTALPAPEPASVPPPESARTRAPTRQTALTDSGLEAPAASPVASARSPSPRDTDHQPLCTHPAASSSRAASSKARSCSRPARRFSSVDCGKREIHSRRHHGRRDPASGSRSVVAGVAVLAPGVAVLAPGMAATAGADAAEALAPCRCPARAIVEIAIPP